jgi:hypothetical protein
MFRHLALRHSMYEKEIKFLLLLCHQLTSKAHGQWLQRLRACADARCALSIRINGRNANSSPAAMTASWFIGKE